MQHSGLSRFGAFLKSFFEVSNHFYRFIIGEYIEGFSEYASLTPCEIIAAPPLKGSKNNNP